jgi:hypothetical protein
MQRKEPWEMTIEELREASQGGKIDPFGGAEDEIAALCSATKPVVFDKWPQPVDRTTFDKIASAYLTRKPASCSRSLYVAPIGDDEGMIGLTIALTKEAAMDAAREIVALPHDVSYDGRMGRILGYSEADIASWYLNMQNHVDAFLRFAHGDMDKAATMFQSFCAGRSLEDAISSQDG